MQHLDEGTIHSWLDGALSIDEAAQVEAHVNGCPQCASAVAEAHGFIAASSRILTALDDAPRGVVPVAAPRKRVNPMVWRVAATVLVVAAGTLVVVRNRGNERPTSISADRAIVLPQPTSIAERAPAAAGPATALADGASAKAAASDAPAIPLLGKAGTRSSRSDVATRESKALAEGGTVRAGQTAVTSDVAGVAAPTARTLAPSRVAGVGAMDAASESEPLKVIGTPRRMGAKVTLYEITPGDTVTLTEALPLSLQSIVVTGAAVAPMAAARATEKSAGASSKTRVNAGITTAPETQSAGGVTAAAPAVSAPAPSQQEIPNTVHTITWTDSATGNTLTLTGRMPEARLQEIKIRIQRDRATTAAKKNP